MFTQCRLKVMVCVCVDVFVFGDESECDVPSVVYGSIGFVD